MQRKFIVIFTSVVLVVALTSIWIRLRPSQPKIDRAPIIGAATGIGLVLAEETLQAIHNQGSLVLVTDHDHKQNNRSRDYRWEAFQAEIKKHDAVTIAATEIVEFDPNEPMVSGCPSAALKAILERHASAAAIVFFIDLPEWIRVAAIIPRPVRPKIIAVDSVTAPTMLRYEGYFASGTLSVLIGARPVSPDESSVKPKTPRAWFDRHYQIYTPQNFESLPD